MQYLGAPSAPRYAAGMITGMITCTAREHTGRPLRASLPATLAYLLVHVAAALRVLARSPSMGRPRVGVQPGEATAQPP